MEAEQGIPRLRIDWWRKAWSVWVYYPARYGTTSQRVEDAQNKGDGESKCNLDVWLGLTDRQNGSASHLGDDSSKKHEHSSRHTSYNEKSEISPEAVNRRSPESAEHSCDESSENGRSSDSTPSNRAHTFTLAYDLSSDSTSSNQSIQKIRDWTNQCYAHWACNFWQYLNGVAWSAVPTRLLELTPTKRHPTIRLVNTADLQEGSVFYTTLSHCWGHTLNFELLRNNARRLRTAIPWNSLPRTFQDAAIVTARLGVRYLWIDSLCIMQDDKDDWAKEASRMSAVYTNSVLNLAADASRDSHGGLFRRREPRLVHSFFVPSVHPRLDEREYLCYANSWDEDVEKTQLSSRAWVLQELYDFWTRTITDYSLRRLTYASDRSIALAGLARAFCHYAGLEDIDYAAGLWRPNIVNGLLWTVSHRYQGLHTSWDLGPLTRKRILGTTTPSWSWLYLDAVILPVGKDILEEQVPMSQLRRCHIAEIIEVVMAPGDPFGPTCSGHIRLSVPMCTAILRQIVTNPRQTYPCNALDVGPQRLLEGEDFWLSLDEEETQSTDRTPSVEDEAGASGRLLGVLLMASDYPFRKWLGSVHDLPEEHHCLLVEFTKEKRGQVRRIGHIRLIGSPCFGVDCSGKPTQIQRTPAYVQPPKREALSFNFRSRDVPEECYEEVNEALWYTVTLV
ncbi:hypothetical protein LTR17_001494 [Elasticomyces elasticus]|nr:hypothetical protein LTR17_001494 [Elasticomyces elasticus]